MKSFFNYVKSKFFWILLFVFVDFFSIICFFTMLDSLFTAMDISFSIPFSMLYLVSDFPLIISFLASFILFRLFSFLSLRIYSYKLYVGNNNWYKFSNVTDKVYKQFDKVLYDEYRKGNFDINYFDVHNIDFNAIVGNFDVKSRTNFIKENKDE